MPKSKTELLAQPQPSQGSSPIRFDRRLLTGFTDEEAQEFQIRFNSCASVRDAISKVLTKELENAILQSESRDRLASPNYLADQADLYGFRRGLRLAIKLLTKQETND